MPTPYKVLLVDDEPLVLAGIKMMLDWPAYNCELTGTARNGKAALALVQSTPPDIIITDINMPIMDGMELLRQVSNAYPQIVFIVLTNLQEFDLVRKSLRYQAADYLIKTQLEPHTLGNALEGAVKLAGQRRSQYSRPKGAVNIVNKREYLLRDAAVTILTGGTPSQAAQTALQETGIVNGCFFLEIQMLYPQQNTTNKDSEPQRLFMWETEIVLEVANNCFDSFLPIPTELTGQSVLLLVWGQNSPLHKQVPTFCKKLQAASANITRVTPCVLQTGLLVGERGLLACRSQLQALRDYFYLHGPAYVQFNILPAVTHSGLGLSGIAARLAGELRSTNIAGFHDLLDTVIARTQAVEHEKSQGIWLCTEVYSAVYQEVRTLGLELPPDSIFADSARGHRYISFLATRQNVAALLRQIQTEAAQLFLASGKSTDIVELARQYVAQNIENRITLPEIARHVAVSPGYLSALFKKRCNENLVSYINRAKIELACELIQQDKYSMNEISARLSFENAYYFSRVFRRFLGITPSEYRTLVRSGKPLPATIVQDEYTTKA